MQTPHLLKAIGLLLCLTAPALAQNPCEGPQHIRDVYTESAYRLAVRALQTSTNSYKDSITIPVDVVEAQLRPLMAVYTSQSINRDTVVDLLQIQNYHSTFPHIPLLNRLHFSIPDSINWATNWYAKDSLTGEPQLDALIQRYQLRIVQALKLSHQKRINVDMASNAFLNMPNLVKAFEALAYPGLNVSVSGIAGDGNYILADAVNGKTILTYSYGMGDCPAGCEKRRNWVFSVDSACGVVFLGSNGAPYDSRTGTGIGRLSERKLLVYPNPATNQLHFSPAEGSGTYSFSVYSISGEQVLYRENEDVHTSSSLFIGDLAQGLYLLKLQSEEGTYHSFFFKE